MRIIPSPSALNQNHFVNGLPSSEMVVTTIGLSDGSSHRLSKFGDDEWVLPETDFVHNASSYMRKLSFQKIPPQFQDILKVACLKYYQYGLEGSTRPRGSTIVNFFKNAQLFLRYLAHLNIMLLSSVSELTCINYAQSCSQTINPQTKKNLTGNALRPKFMALETLHQLTQDTFDVMPPPWKNTTASFLSGIETGNKINATTKIIPKEILSAIFSAAVKNIETADVLLSLRIHVSLIKKQYSGYAKSVICEKINLFLSKNGHIEGLQAFNKTISRVLDGCMIIILITSGIRIHELASLKINCSYTTYGKDDELYHWISGLSEKTHEGNTDWLVTELTHKAIQITTQLTAPSRDNLISQVNANSSNRALADKLNRHVNSLFLVDQKNSIQTLSSSAIRERINKFANHYGIAWRFTPHQFRRTFAVYAAHSALGDLRYLRQHFKHWSLDMTALYAINEQQDTELYDAIMTTIKNEKIAIVEHWLDEDTLITGGMAEQIITFRKNSDPVRTYSSRRILAERLSEQVHIRATTVGWCTADNGGCAGGEMLERTRCSGCENAMIDDRKKSIWLGIYQQQLELNQIDDIGSAGKERVARDIKRCEFVLNKLGVKFDKGIGSNHEQEY